MDAPAPQRATVGAHGAVSRPVMCAGAAVNTVYLIIALVQKTPYCWPGLARDGRPITALRGQRPVVNDPLHDER